MDIVEGYRQRTYNEDMVVMENLGGLQGLLDKLHTSIDKGLTPHDFDQRQAAFGTNFKAPPKINPYWRLFLGALDDFMLKFLMVCAVIELAIEVGFADDHERQTGKYYKICWFWPTFVNSHATAAGRLFNTIK